MITPPYFFLHWCRRTGSRSLLCRWVALSVLLLTCVIQAEESQVYKCYVLDVEEQSHLYYAAVPPSKRQRFVSNLPGNYVLDAQGKPQVVIAEVLECKQQAQPFTYYEARQLERISPR